MHSPPTVVSYEEDSEAEEDSVLPPSTRCPPGRPPKCRIDGGQEEVNRPKRPFKCGRCGKNGHAGTMCHEGINNAAA